MPKGTAYHTFLRLYLFSPSSFYLPLALFYYLFILISFVVFDLYHRYAPGHGCHHNVKDLGPNARAGSLFEGDAFPLVFRTRRSSRIGKFPLNPSSPQSSLSSPFLCPLSPLFPYSFLLSLSPSSSKPHFNTNIFFFSCFIFYFCFFLFSDYP